MKRIRTFFLPVVLLSLCSCVTTLSTPKKYIAVQTQGDETVIMNGDTLQRGITPSEMAIKLGVDKADRKSMNKMRKIVYRSNFPETAYGFYNATSAPLQVCIYAADTVSRYNLKAYNSNLFWLNFCSLGIGMFEDLNNDNRYEHPDLYLRNGAYHTFRKGDWNLNTRKKPGAGSLISRKKPGAWQTKRAARFQGSFMKGRVNISLSLPWSQLFSIYPVSTGIRRNIGGFIGIGAGIEYFYRDKRGIALELNGLEGFPQIIFALPVPNETLSAINISLSEYLHFRRFTIGYGLNAAQLEYEYGPPHLPGYGTSYLGSAEISDKYWAAGIMIAAYLNITPKMIFGISYRPTFYRFGAIRPWGYEHTLALDLKFYLLRK